MIPTTTHPASMATAMDAGAKLKMPMLIAQIIIRPIPEEEEEEEEEKAEQFPNPCSLRTSPPHLMCSSGRHIFTAERYQPIRTHTSAQMQQRQAFHPPALMLYEVPGLASKVGLSVSMRTCQDYIHK
jgi:hypothetical protein